MCANNTISNTTHSHVVTSVQHSQTDSTTSKSPVVFDNENNYNNETEAPSSSSRTHVSEHEDLAAKYSEMKEAAERCYLMIEHQRRLLQGYDDLVGEHLELKKEFEAITLENKMWELDLERERWTHKQHLKSLVLISQKMEEPKENRIGRFEYLRKQCFAIGS